MTSAVKGFVITRSYSMCSRPSLPWTRCGAPGAATCNAVGAEARGRGAERHGDDPERRGDDQRADAFRSSVHPQ